MSPENVHDRKENRHFTIVLVPGGDSARTRTISISRWGFFLSGFVFLAVTIAGIYSLLVFTPVRSLLPVSNPELEKRYGRQIFQIQEEVSRLVEEMNVLRSYNLRLRKALGETMNLQDSTLLATHDVAAVPKNVLQNDALREPVTQAQTTTSTAANALSQNPASTSNMASVANREPAERTTGSGVSLGSPITHVDFPMSKPTDGYVTQGFDVARYHLGMDFAGKKSTAVLAAADGNVVFSGWTYDDGFMIMVAHGLGYMSVYKHNESLLKSTGAFVKRGEPIALLGNTGRTSTGPHLHFEVWKDGIAYDPGQFLLTTQ